jgi:RNA-directed DNA polymerase
LLISWQEFLKGKRKRRDVCEFSINLSDNIFNLHKKLTSKEYKHGKYFAFKINDPKPRDIHKASVEDRLVHHAACRILYPYFEKKFIYDSYSCRIAKGTHRAINKFREYGRKVSKNDTAACWVLKGDIRKFFASINHDVLNTILSKYIKDDDTLWLLNEIIISFNTGVGVGLPLGNLTSQLLINVYMNEFDQFVKRTLKVKYYIRYADDFVILHKDKQYLVNHIPKLSEFLENELKLSLHQNKLYVKTLSSGVDFLGWVNFPHHRILRTATKRRVFRKLKQKQKREIMDSYIGLLKFGSTHKLMNHFLYKNYLR